jgi:hypothetical protein
MVERSPLRSVANGIYNILPPQRSGEGEPLPRPGVSVWVQCGASTTPAYRDAAGVWRSYARGQELKHLVKMRAAILRSRRVLGANGREFNPLQQLLGLLSLMPYALAT